MYLLDFYFGTDVYSDVIAPEVPKVALDMVLLEMGNEV